MIMRKYYLLSCFLCISIISNAQPKAIFSQSISLSNSDSIDTYEYLRNWENKKEIEENLAKKYTTQILPTLYQELKTDIKDEKELENYILYSMEREFSVEYKRYYGAKNNMLGEVGYNDFVQSLFRSCLKKKSMRDFLFNRLCDILCDFVSLYPKDYKKKLISLLNESLEMLNDIPNHKYEIKDGEGISDEYWPVFGNGVSGDLVIFKDGIGDRKLGYGVNGFVLRRIFIDNIPYTEIKEKMITLINELKSINNSNNSDVYSCVVINNDIAYCIGSENNYFISIFSNKKYVPYEKDRNGSNFTYFNNVVKYRENKGNHFYLILNKEYEKPRAIVIDKNAEVIYKE